MRLGPVQIARLRSLAGPTALVIGDDTSRRLVALGLLASDPDGNMVTITPNGLRALADAVDAGRVDLRGWINAKRKGARAQPGGDGPGYGG